MVSLDWILLGFRLLATVILYTFLGLAFYILWRDLKHVARQAMHQPPMSYQLRVVASANGQSPALGDVLSLYPVTFLGRDADNTIVLYQPGEWRLVVGGFGQPEWDQA
jgi:hypothetical protein